MNTPHAADPSALQSPTASDAGYARANSHLQSRRAFNAPVPVMTEKAMGVNVVLCNERGVPVESPGDVALVFPEAALGADHVETSTLRFIDRYGNTMFNGAQCADLADELAAVANHLSDPDRRAIRLVVDLALRCAATSHTYLWFIGD